MGQQVEEVVLVERIAAACQGYFRDPPEKRDVARLVQFCVELVRRGRCVVYTYATDETHFWLALDEARRQHTVADKPVLHGSMLDVWHDGRWVRGQYIARGFEDRHGTPDCVLSLETRPPALVHVDQTDEPIIARWPRGPLL